MAFFLSIDTSRDQPHLRLTRSPAMIYHSHMQTSVRPQPQDLHPEGEVSVPPGPARTQPLPLIIVKAMRPKQWTKNGLLFAALLFSLEFTHWDSIWRSIVGFVLFCSFSS